MLKYIGLPGIGGSGAKRQPTSAATARLPHQFRMVQGSLASEPL